MVLDHERLIGMLTRLKLTAIRDQLDSLLDEAARRELSLREALAFLVEREVARKDERRIEMAGKIAHFPMVRDLDGFDFAAQPSLDLRQVRADRLAGNREHIQVQHLAQFQRACLGSEFVQDAAARTFGLAQHIEEIFELLFHRQSPPRDCR